MEQMYYQNGQKTKNDRTILLTFMEVIEKIKKEIYDQRLTVRRLSELTGLNKSTVNNLSVNTTLDKFLKIITALKKTPCDFFCDKSTNYSVSETSKNLSLLNEPAVNYNADYKQKYFDLMERHNKLLEEVLILKDPLNPIKKTKTKK